MEQVSLIIILILPRLTLNRYFIGVNIHKEGLGSIKDE
jgi:hypothetical protein